MGLKVDLANTCEHKKLPEVPFNYEECKNLSSDEVRRKYPRLSQNCPECGTIVICYASYSHYILGDW